MLRRCNLVDGKLVDAEEGVVWIFAAPDEAERKLMVEGFTIDEHTLNSALDPDELSRVEQEPEHIAVILKRPKSYSKDDDFLFKVLSNGLFLFKDKLVIVMAEEGPVLEATRVPYRGTGAAADAFLRILYRTIFHFLEHLRVISMMSDSLEQRINLSFDNRHLLNLFKLEKSLVYYVSGISSNTVAIDKLRNAAGRLGLSPEQVEFLEDIAIENQQCFRQAEIASNILASMMDARVSIVSNNLNLTMKTLTMITVAIMVPTFVVSAFSMNVPIPFSERGWAFYVVLVLASVSSAAFVAWGRLKRW
ncbi:MAG: magnesium transporter CorA family protein [Anaeromyxobacter sp.]|nr:magnesium transporter CorA family protein [Anaeromyxobacter sp.]MBL0277156.1 magnesium transporter CorA family protein [Anaeromyxobacter sp.]